MNDGERVLDAMRERPGVWFVNELATATGLHNGKLYPILAGLEKTGAVVSEWQPGEPPRRRGYRVSGVEW